MKLKAVLTALNNATVTDVAYKSYVAHTPIRSGNARRKTKKGVNQVVADYPYAQQLQDNFSPQTHGNVLFSQRLMMCVTMFIAQQV